ncbi:MAG: hypothetical protein QM679_07400 [Patulibacter sp.]
MSLREPALPTKVVTLHRALTAAALDHAFGGALALAYYAEPRATIDIDLNVFVAAEQLEAVTAALIPLGVAAPPHPTAIARDGQGRLHWGRTPIDLFFAYDALHTAMAGATRIVPFAETTIPILSPEHLIVCKASFDRPKDWIDIEQMLVATAGIDRSEAERWLDRIVGGGDQRAQRFADLADRWLGGDRSV